MKIIKHTNITEIKEKWETLYNNNENLTTFQSFELVFKNHNNTRFFPKTYNEKLEVFEFIKNNKTIALLPLIKKGSTYKRAETLDYFELIYSKFASDDELLEGLKALKNTISIPILFDSVNENSKLYNLLKNENISNIKTTECVKISNLNNYEDYYASLSKNARQNLRTSYNRLNKNFNNPKIEIEIIKGQLDSKLIKTLKTLYLKRRTTKNKGFISKIKCFMKRFLYEPISKTCGTVSTGFTSILKINGEIASFMQGVYSKHNDVIIPRLVLNDKFAWYSAGMILINETIKKLIDENITCLDLAIGNENYKFVMGGQINLNYKFTYGV